MLPDASSLSSNGKQLWNAMVKQVKDQRIEVPLLPEVANRAITLSQDPESDSVKLSQLIQSDPSLAAHVMSIANSAAYSPNSSLVSLQQAITRLGMNLICDIAVAASISNRMFSTPGYESHIQGIWQHALASALWAKEIARACRLNVEATFLCGLLHSIGRPVALQDLIVISKRLSLDVTEQEMQALEDGLQKVVGAHVLKKWGMPTIICESHQYLQDYRNAPHAMEQASIVHAATRFAHHMLSPEQLSLEELTNSEVFEDLNLYQDEVQLLLNKGDSVKSSMEAMSAK